MISDQARRSPLVPHGPTPEQRSQAVRVVAGHAKDADDLVELLDMLGLAASEASEPGSGPTKVVPSARDERAPRRKLTIDELTAMFEPLGATAR